MRSFEAFLIGILVSTAGGASFYWANRLTAAGTRGLGDLLGVFGLVLGMVGLYFLVMGAMRLRRN